MVLGIFILTDRGVVLSMLSLLPRRSVHLFTSIVLISVAANVAASVALVCMIPESTSSVRL